MPAEQEESWDGARGLRLLFWFVFLSFSMWQLDLS